MYEDDVTHDWNLVEIINCGKELGLNSELVNCNKLTNIIELSGLRLHINLKQDLDTHEGLSNVFYAI